MILISKQCSRNLTNFQISWGPLDQNKNSSQNFITYLRQCLNEKMFFSNDIESESKMTFWSILTWTFNTLLTTEVELEPQEFNHTTVIVNYMSKLDYFS